MSISSPSRALVSLPYDEGQWQIILHASNQVVLYNPRSHALSVNKSTDFISRSHGHCPYCKQTLPPDFDTGLNHQASLEQRLREKEGAHTFDAFSADPAHHTRTSDYFRLLAIANEASSRPPTPPPFFNNDHDRHSLNVGPSGNRNRNEHTAFPSGTMAEGYFQTFFQEEYKLGMGANGSVFLCQHVLDGNSLGHFAVKKIAVGESHSYLLRILREVRLLERLHHPNIVTYHHAWLETCQFSSFGPKVPTLHVLMQWAEGGSLDDFIDVRIGRKPAHMHISPLAPLSLFSRTYTPAIPSNTASTSPKTNITTTETAQPKDLNSRSARIRAFRAFQKASPAEREHMCREMDMEYENSGQHGLRKNAAWRAVHLLSAAEVKSLFGDVVEGLAFLHDKSILHLDLKPGNVLLTWDEGHLIPRAMLSDFGTSRDMINTSRIARSGNTGTLEYTSPESLPSPQTGLLQQIDSKSDIWSLGMILHKILFFKLPYKNAAAGDADGIDDEKRGSTSKLQESKKMEALEREVLEYPGFKSTPALATAFEARRLPRSFLVLLESLLNKTPGGRPSVERVSVAIREGKLDPLRDLNVRDDASSLVSRSNHDGSIFATPENIRLLESPSNDHKMYSGATLSWSRRALSVFMQNQRIFFHLAKNSLLTAKIYSISLLYARRHGTPNYNVVATLVGAAIADSIWEPSNVWNKIWSPLALLKPLPLSLVENPVPTNHV